MSLPSNLKFACSILKNIDGYEIKALKPDADGCYPVVLGCLGGPTRNNVIYDPESVLQAMGPESKFTLSLQNGYLFGELGHPDIYGKGPNGMDDIRRLLTIREDKVSHLFTEIYIDETPVMIDGSQGYPIRAKVKPMGPYGEVLRKSLEDPMCNTAFSIRTLCRPMTGDDRRYTYRKVETLVTFDAVCAPGYALAAKRYVPGVESLSEIDVTKQELLDAVAGTAGMESGFMLTDKDIARIFDLPTRKVGHTTVSKLVGKHNLYDTEGNLIDTATLVYRNRR